MERVADPLAITARRNGARSETIAFLLVLAVIVVAPLSSRRSSSIRFS